MAIFDAVLIGPGKYKAFSEKKDDIKQDSACKLWAEGSAIVSLNLDEDTTGQSPSVHVKLPEGGYSGIEEEEDQDDG